MSKKPSRETDPRLYAELFPEFHHTRSQKTLTNILESAAVVYSKRGAVNTRLDDIAKAAKLTRPALRYYFSDLNALFWNLSRYIRACFQRDAIEALQGADQDPVEGMRNYLVAMYDWYRKKPSHQRTWILFYSACVTDKTARILNTEMVNVGAERLEALIELGIQKGLFQCSDIALTARTIQILVTGHVVTMATENRDSVLDVMLEGFIKIVLQDLLHCEPK